MEKEIKLKVAEAVQDDVNKGIVRIDSNLMKDINVNPGDIVEIEGGRKTVGLVDRAYPGDIGLNIIRMDGLTRRNAKTGIGETIKIRKSEFKEAKKVIIGPATKGVMIRAPPDLFKQGLLGRAVIKGDIVSLGGSTTRKKTMTGNPFFDDLFSELEEQFSGISAGFGFSDIKFVVTDVDPKGAVYISNHTQVEFNPEAVELKEEEAAPEVTYEDIGGLHEEITKVREMVELPLKYPEIFERLGIEAPKGVLFFGPPGTGKTLLAKAVANETNSHFILINGPEIMSKFYGQSEANLRQKFEEAQKNAPSIIFIDEIDAIASKREETPGEVEKRVVAQLLSLMDGLQSRGKVVVIAASNVPNLLDPALRRPGRFDRELEIGVPNQEGRETIMKIHTRSMPLAKDVNIKKIAEMTYGFVGADLSALAKEAAMIVLRRVLPEIKFKGKKDKDKEEEIAPLPKEVLEKLIVAQKDFKEALKVVRPSAMREVFVEVPNIKWEDIGGMEDSKKELKESVEWPLQHPKSFSRLGIRPPRGILLYGAPGTGKTLMAKAVATESGANFIYVKGPALLSMWVGESEKGIRNIFKKARQTSPTIIFFDEIDSLAPRRGATGGSHVTETVVNQMLTEMDGLEDLQDVVVIAATNRPDMLDTALLRPGRFDRIVRTDVPNESSRLEIFKVHTKNMPINGVKLEKLAKETQGYVGADIEAICREAAMIALRENMDTKDVKQKHFEKAMEKVRPSVDKDIEKSYVELEDKFRAAKAKEMEEQKPNYMG